MHTATLWIGFVQSLTMAFIEVDEAVLYLHMYLHVYLLYAERKIKWRTPLDSEQMCSGKQPF